MFGVHLEKTIHRPDGVVPVPVVVQKLIQFLSSEEGTRQWRFVGLMDDWNVSPRVACSLIVVLCGASSDVLGGSVPCPG